MSEISELSKIIADLENSEDIEMFLHELLTESERKDLSLRWKLMGRLYEGVPQRRIAADLGISLCKITRGSKILKDKNSVARKILEEKGGH